MILRKTIMELILLLEEHRSAYKSLFPIIVFDVRKQNEKLKVGVMDIQVKFEFGAAVPADTTAYAVIISDRFYKLSSDGKNMSVVSI